MDLKFGSDLVYLVHDSLCLFELDRIGDDSALFECGSHDRAVDDLELFFSILYAESASNEYGKL